MVHLSLDNNNNNNNMDQSTSPYYGKSPLASPTMNNSVGGIGGMNPTKSPSHLSQQQHHHLQQQQQHYQNVHVPSNTNVTTTTTSNPITPITSPSQ
ncbi:hypothetical protein CYY_001366 [Polysphondylium violaceum]|uniref:Uncharacterized protein n=1 Tax=Polysphondylium violaceum TaxID=133409 RepID=A0A8J4Q006_9MYCE|nr:hypothetical protein CYY_001366 [Polysphondylium violaceum]